jgi:hypothetical protein
LLKKKNTSLLSVEQEAADEVPNEAADERILLFIIMIYQEGR